MNEKSAYIIAASILLAACLMIGHKELEKLPAKRAAEAAQQQVKDREDFDFVFSSLKYVSDACVHYRESGDATTFVDESEAWTYCFPRYLKNHPAAPLSQEDLPGLINLVKEALSNISQETVSALETEAQRILIKYGKS